jgi:23S rRNA pseudouridine2605 synthase
MKNESNPEQPRNSDFGRDKNSNLFRGNKTPQNSNQDNKDKDDEGFDWRKDIPKREYSVDKPEEKKERAPYPGRKPYIKRDGDNRDRGNRDNPRREGGGGYGGGYNRDRNDRRDSGGGGYRREGGGGYGGGDRREDRRSGGYNRDRNDRNDRGGYNKKPFQKKQFFEKPKPLEEQVVRLNRYIANAGICSRREADKLILAGEISVNGKVVTEMGVKVNPGDEVKYNGKVIRSEKQVYIIMNKPKDTITTSDDPEERRTVIDLLSDNVPERVYPVGRLDRNTTGVLVLTNDGDLSQKLTHPSYNIKKIYLAVLDKPLTKDHLEQLAAGVKLEDGFIKPDAIDYVDDQDKRHIGVEIHSGRNHIIHRMFGHFEYNLEKLDRVSYAGLTKKDMKRGQWRFLTEQEVGHLRRITSKKKYERKPLPNRKTFDRGGERREKESDTN